MPRPNSVRAQNVLRDLVLGINNYRVEYNHRFPLLKGRDEKVDQRVEATGKWLNVLLGRNEDGLNPREIAYIEPPMAKEGKGGLFRDGASGGHKLTDPWGHPYVVLMDANNDNRIDNPDRRNSSPLVNKDAPATIASVAVAYSLGPDGVEGTADDIASWRSASAVATLPQAWRDVLSLGAMIATLISILVIVGQGFWLLVDLVSLLRDKSKRPDEGSVTPP